MAKRKWPKGMKTISARLILTAEDLWSCVDIKGPDDCWLWMKAVNRYGYGDVAFRGKRTNASRAAYFLNHPKADESLVVCHTCDNPKCCNPKHLWLGTAGDNVRDCNKKGRGKGQFTEKMGAAHPRYLAKLTEELVIYARKLHYIDGISQSEIARRFKMDSSSISRAVKRETWDHI